MRLVESSLLSEVGYNDEGEELTLVFKDGKRYVYVAVPAEVYDALMAAGSIGRYFLKNIKGKFACRQELNFFAGA